MTEEKAGKARRDPIEKASGNLEKALETISKRLLDQIKDGETPSKELGELAKVMKLLFLHTPTQQVHLLPYIAGQKSFLWIVKKIVQKWTMIKLQRQSLKKQKQL